MALFCVFCEGEHASFDCRNILKSGEKFKRTDPPDRKKVKQGRQIKITPFLTEEKKGNNMAFILPVGRIPFKKNGGCLLQPKVFHTKSTETELTANMILTVDDFEQALSKAIAALHPVQNNSKLPEKRVKMEEENNKHLTTGETDVIGFS